MQVAKVSLESNLLKWSVKQYYLKALLCNLVLASNNLGVVSILIVSKLMSYCYCANMYLLAAQTVDDVREKRGEYCGLDPTFEETREDNLIVVRADAT
jgi:hypothetical protein